ncbi:MAG: enoyl-CoA hydratase-related protein [Rhizomicrobium sp.]
MTYGPYEQIAVAVDQGILTLTLNRPEKLNAFTAKMMHEMIDVFTKVNTDDAVGAVIVTSARAARFAPVPIFPAARAPSTPRPIPSARNAMRAPNRQRELERRARARRWRPRDARDLRMSEARDRGNQRSVGRHRHDNATRHGYPHREQRCEVRLCVCAPRHRSGSGFELVSSAACRHQPGAGNGAIPAACSRPDEALKGGLVSEIVEPADLLPRARALARDIIDNTAPVSIALIRQMMWRGMGMDHPMEAHKVDSRGIYARGASADVREGVSSFLEKRPAKFPQAVSTGMPPYFPWWKDRPYS